MLQLNLPKKPVAIVQVWISLALIVFSIIFAFNPLAQIDLSSSDASTALNAGLAYFGEDFEELTGMEKPEKVEITSLKVVKAVSMYSKLNSIILTSDETEAGREKIEKNKAELTDDLNTLEGREAVVMSVVLVGQVVDFGSIGNIDKSIFARTLMSIVKGVILFYIALCILIYPFALIIVGVVCLILTLTHLKDPEKYKLTVTATLPCSNFALTVMLMLALTAFPGIELGMGTEALLILTIANTVVNFIASRCRKYKDNDFKYLNVTQGTAAVETVGFILFFSNLLKANVVMTFLKSIGNYITELITETLDINSAIKAYNSIRGNTAIASFSPSGSYAVDIILVLIFATLALSASTRIVRCIAGRLGLTAGKRKRFKSNLFGSVLALIVAILPLLLSSLNNAVYYSITEIGENGVTISEEATSFITMTPELMSVVIGMIVGAVIILIAAIVRNNLADKYTISLDGENLLLNGAAPSPDDDGSKSESAEQ